MLDAQTNANIRVLVVLERAGLSVLVHVQYIVVIVLDV